MVWSVPSAFLDHFELTWFSSMISYPNYKFYWPIRALGLYSKRFDNKELQ